jgi:hypothetical protein
MYSRVDEGKYVRKLMLIITIVTQVSLIVNILGESPQYHKYKSYCLLSATLCKTVYNIAYKFIQVSV